MDANEDIQSNKDFKHFCTSNNLVDLFHHFSPSQVNTPTYARGKKRIDYALCSPNLTEYVVSAKINPLAGVQENADHTALEICLDRKKLMRKEKPSKRPAARQLTFKNPASVRRYQDIVTQYFKDHKLLRRVNLAAQLFKDDPEIRGIIKPA